MKKEYRPTQEFMDYLIKVNNDPKYKYETEPGTVFCEEIDGKYGIKIHEFYDGPDPPDFELNVNTIGKVGLEVTALTDPNLRQFGSYFDDVENILTDVIGLYIHFLPVASYMFNYFPGDLQPFGKGKIEVQNDNFRMSLDEMREKLDKLVSQWFSRFSIEGNRSITIHDKNGNPARFKMMHNFPSEKKEFSLYPQGIYKDIDNNEELKTELQNAVNRKNEKYQGKSWLNGYKQVWLLLYILSDEMALSQNVNIEEINVGKKLFDRIFVLRKIITDYKVYELVTD